ncbi:OmpA family protein [Magnetospirillum sp. UT-4]|uniref:OmpA family protein n=1 Tax=Magnetospirillum sp. UT-4 TaxID=2681467 RepID=UPI0013857CD4|nr:OmpA family protein [Magnetospirillum sp. UT-4]CAA7612740.1 Outer membrane protein and related peptidoglycan-associated (Lipo)proteins [Magnetospirillum sp. UT-4]
MRTMKTLIAAGLLAAAVPATADAQWYMGLDAGTNYMQDPGVTGTDSDWGWLGLGQVGYSFGAPKVEFELGYRANDNIDSLTTMVNVLYDFMPTSKWHPMVGAGIGWAFLDGDFAGTNAKNSDNAFAYQGILGLGYDISNNFMLKTQYRYLGTTDTDVGTSTQKADYDNHAITVGFTYKFAKPTPAPAPAPAPVAAPAPAPAPVAKPAPAMQKQFLVFFDFNKADITPEAAKVITQAVAAAKAGNAAKIDLTGHADRSGSDKYNMALSMKRGNAVKDAMIKQGIPANQIAVVAKGESVPLVATPDGVREPQNRRVEIVLP